MPGTLDRAVLFVQLALDEVAVVMRTAVLDGEDLPPAVDYTDFQIFPRDQALLARRKLVKGADVDQWTQGHGKIRFRRYGFYRRVCLTPG